MVKYSKTAKAIISHMTLLCISIAGPCKYYQPKNITVIRILFSFLHQMKIA